MREFAEGFYRSKAWRELSHMVRVQTGGQCQQCGRLLPMDRLIAHHKVELTPENINDPTIALSADNLAVLCQTCHNEVHCHFGGEQRAFIVWGSPLSGKSTFVRKHMRYGDLVVDVDEIWLAVSGQRRYVKPNQLKGVVFHLLREIHGAVKMRHGKWYTAWVIMSTPDKGEVERKAKELGAEVLVMESSRAECLERCEDRPQEWVKFVEDWWDENG